MKTGFAIWITGLPASGKSTVSVCVADRLRHAGICIAVLESDEMRKALTPEPTYTQDERDRFYLALATIGRTLTKNGINVIFDATANMRAYRDRARAMIPKFIEVYISCPIEVCESRDPKGIYRRARSGGAATVPGIQAEYEPPLRPEVTLNCLMDKAAAADAVIVRLKEFQYI